MIVSLGVHILDVLGRYVTDIPYGQNLAILDEIRMTVAGTAAGTSVDLAKLGNEVVAIGAVGNDEAGTFVIDTMNRYGIDTACLVRKHSVQTSASMLPIRPNGERPALHVLGANAEFALDDVPMTRIAQADHVHLGGTFVMPKFDGEPSAVVLEYAKKNGATTSLDMLAIPREDMVSVLKPVLPYVDFFMPGLDEAAMISGFSNRADIVSFFLDLGASHTVFTMGADGCSIAGSGMPEIRVPAYKANVVDSTGCGDAFCAGFITGLQKGWDLVECARLGAASGALVVSGLGSDAGIVDFDSTLSFMRTAEMLPMS